MTRDEISLLLYVETRCVDGDSRIDSQKINEEDRAILKEWEKTGFVKHGRIRAADVTTNGSMWVELSDAAWAQAHAERRARADRISAKRTWVKTIDLRNTAANS